MRARPEQQLAGATLAAYRQVHVGPVRTAFAAWLGKAGATCVGQVGDRKSDHVCYEPMAGPAGVPDRRPTDDHWTTQVSASSTGERRAGPRA